MKKLLMVLRVLWCQENMSSRQLEDEYALPHPSNNYKYLHCILCHDMTQINENVIWLNAWSVWGVGVNWTQVKAELIFLEK